MNPIRILLVTMKLNYSTDWMPVNDSTLLWAVARRQNFPAIIFHLEFLKSVIYVLFYKKQ